MTSLSIRIEPTTRGNPPGKLADAEIHFQTGPLQGLKLIGFSVWERRTGGSCNVTFPARSYSINGERRSFALLRPANSDRFNAQDRLRDLVLDAYRRYTETDARETAYDRDGNALQTPAPVDQDDPLTRGTRAHQAARQVDLSTRPGLTPIPVAPLAQAAETLATHPELQADAGTVIASAIVQATRTPSPDPAVWGPMAHGDQPRCGEPRPTPPTPKARRF